MISKVTLRGQFFGSRMHMYQSLDAGLKGLVRHNFAIMENNKYRGKLIDVFTIDGREIKTYENNDPDLDPDIILSLLARGCRSPQNEQEKRWLKSINETRAKGYGIELPFN